VVTSSWNSTRALAYSICVPALVTCHMRRKDTFHMRRRIHVIYIALAYSICVPTLVTCHYYGKRTHSIFSTITHSIIVREHIPPLPSATRARTYTHTHVNICPRHLQHSARTHNTHRHTRTHAHRETESARARERERDQHTDGTPGFSLVQFSSRMGMSSTKAN
jgi:hypothetical protein